MIKGQAMNKNTGHSIKVVDSHVLSVILVLCLFPPPVFAQKENSDEIRKAVQRSEKASQAVETIMSLADQSIPKELLDKAEAIAVFPDVVKLNLFLDKFTYGHGAVCRRISGRWSVPVYISFKGAGMTLKIVGKKSPDVVMLFMNEKAVQWLEKGAFELKGEKKAIGGPVGVSTNDQKDTVANANIIVYSLDKGQLTGSTLSSSLFNSFGITHDNNLNKALYKMKARNILAGDLNSSQPLPTGVNKFQQTLNTLLPRP